MPLINTTYVSPTADWPPHSERKRFNDMGDQKNIYENKPAALRILYPSVQVKGQTLFPDIDVNTGLYPRVHSNLLKRLSVFWGNSLFSRPPILDFGSETLNNLAQGDMTMINDAGFKVAVNCSRYGTGLYWLTKNSRGDLSVRSLDPRYWVPIVDPMDQQTITGDVIAVPFDANPNAAVGGAPTHITVTIIVPGQAITTNVYQYEQLKLGALVSSKKGGIAPGRMIFQVVNSIEESHYGESDYSPDAIAIMAEINRRMSANSLVMDQHTDPNIVGPKSIVSEDTTTGDRTVTTKGAYLPIDKDDPRPEYLTWDGKLESNFGQIERALDQFFMITSTSRAAFGIPNQSSSVESGAALRKHLFNSFQKTSQLRALHEAAIADMAQLMYGTRPSISWPEPFVDGSLEFIQTIQIRLATGTMSRAQAVSELNLVPLSVAEKIIEGIPAPQNMNQNAGPGGQADAETN